MPLLLTSNIDGEATNEFDLKALLTIARLKGTTRLSESYVDLRFPDRESRSYKLARALLDENPSELSATEARLLERILRLA